VVAHDRAVMASVGTLAGIAGVLGVCGFAALHFPVFGLFSACSVRTRAVCVLIDPLVGRLRA